jgi:hypothetical protein
MNGEREASARDKKRAEAWLGAGLFLAVTAFFGARAAAQYRPLSYLVGDCPYYALAAVSLVQDGDLDLRNQLNGGLEVHGRQIALGRDGQWYPKHPLLMPLAAAPFVLAFGVPGVLLFNIAVLGALAVALMRLARPFAPSWAAAIAALLLLAGTFLRRYDYNFSPDLFATLILALGLGALLRGRPLAGGIVLALAAAAKLTHLFLLPLGLLYAGLRDGWRGAARACAGAAGPLLALGALNLALFGSAGVTSYDRNVVVEDGEAVLVSHRGSFDQDLLRGLRGEMFDRRQGLLPTSPALWLALPGFVLFFRRSPREALLCLAIGEFLLLFFATYRFWATSHYGNRFLMPLVALSAPAVARALEWMGVRLRLRLSRLRRAAMPEGAAP